MRSRPVRLVPAQAEADIVGDAEMRKQSAILRHEADAAPMRRNRMLRIGQQLAVEHDAPAVGRLEAGDQAQKRRLAGARRADDRGAADRRDAQVDAVQRRHRAVALAQAGDLEKAHRPASRLDWRKSSQVSGSEITIMTTA